MMQIRMKYMKQRKEKRRKLGKTKSCFFAEINEIDRFYLTGQEKGR